jgi:hypothetical protein
MALTKTSAIGVITGLTSLMMTASNPNFNKEDLRRPYQIIQKHDSHSGYDKSGKMYVLAAGAAGAAGGLLVYNALTGNLYARRRED